MSGESLVLLPLLGGAAGYGLSQLVKANIGRRHAQTRVADVLPWSHIDEADDETVWLTGGGAFRVVELGGAIYSGKTEESMNRALDTRRLFFLGQRRSPVRVRVISRRFPIEMAAPAHQAGFVGDLDRAWHELVKDAHSSTHHLILSVERNDQVGRLDEAWRTIESVLGDYSPRRCLNRASDELGGASPLLSFLAQLVSETPAYVPPTKHLHDAVSVASLEFGPDGKVTSFDGATRQRVQVFSVRLWGENTDADVIRKIMALRYPLSVCLSVRTIPQLDTTRIASKRRKQTFINIAGIRDERRRAEEEENVSVIAQEWAETFKELTADKTALHEVEAVFMLSTSDAEAGQAADDLRALVGPRGVVVVPEEQLAERVFWSRLPGYEYMSRQYTMRSENVADLTPWESEPVGLRRCAWGDKPMRYLPSAATRAPYAFVPHIDDGAQAPAHVCVFGPTGGGKTTALGFLLSGALSAYPDLRALVFDQNLGLRVLTQALGGMYMEPGSEELPLNPFDCEVSDKAKARAEKLLAMISGVSEPVDIKALAHGVGDIFTLPRGNRRLSDHWGEVFPAGPIRDGLGPWCEGAGRFAKVFNGTRDAFNPTDQRLTTVAMDGLATDPKLSAALSFYFAQRAADDLAGAPHILWIDEAGTLLKDPYFANEAANFLRTVRRQLGSVWLTFQEVGALRELGGALGNTVQVNCPTTLFWPGTAKTEAELEPYNLTQEETAFVLGRDRLFENARYPVLIKRERESAFVDFDLSGIGLLLRVFMGGTKPTRNMISAIEEKGDKWLETYLAL